MGLVGGRRGKMQNNLNLLELFAGSRCMGIEAEKLGMNVFSVDWMAYKNIDLSIDIENLKPEQIPFTPNHVHASFDCTTYTIAAISTHRNGTEPKSEYAKKCDRVNQHVISLINIATMKAQDVEKKQERKAKTEATNDLKFRLNCVRIY